MSEVITFEEMQHRYDGEWLLIAPEEIDEDLQVIKGEVLAHSPLQEDIYQVLTSISEQPLAIEYVGQVPEDLGSLL
jgi:hypothetical protein